MNELEIRDIEHALNVTIPQCHREMLLFGIDSEEEILIDSMESKEIIAENRKFRLDGPFGGEDWHHHLLVIGRYNSSDIYFIDLQEDTPWLYSAGMSSDPFYDSETYRTDCRLSIIK